MKKICMKTVKISSVTTKTTKKMSIARKYVELGSIPIYKNFLRSNKIYAKLGSGVGTNVLLTIFPFDQSCSNWYFSLIPGLKRWIKIFA